MTRLGPGRISAARSYAASFVANGKLTSEGKTAKVSLADAQKFIDAYAKLMAQFPQATGDVGVALLLGLLEQAPAKLRDTITDSLHNSGQAVGIVATKAGEYEIPKSAEAIADIADFAAHVGMWAGGLEKVQSSTQDHALTPSDVAAARAVVRSTVGAKANPGAINTADEFAAALKASLKARDATAPALPDISIVIELLSACAGPIAQELAATIHNEGVPGGYIRTTQGILHVEKGDLGTADLTTYVQRAGVYAPPAVFNSDARIDSNVLQRLRDRATAFVATGNAFGGPGLSPPALDSEAAFAGALARFCDHLSIRVVVPEMWALAALLEHTPEPLRTKLRDAYHNGGTSSGTLPGESAPQLRNKSMEEAYDFADFVHGRGVWVGGAATPLPTPVAPMSPKTRLDAANYDALRRDVERFLSHGSMDPNITGGPVTITSADDFVAALSALEAQNVYTGGYPLAWLALALTAQLKDAALKSAIASALHGAGALKVVVGGATASRQIDKTSEGAQEVADFVEQQGIWAGQQPRQPTIRYNKTVADVARTLGRQLQESVFNPPWSDLMALYADQGIMGEIRTEADFDKVPRNRSDVRCVWIPNQGLLRWATDEGGHYIGGNHDHIGRGDGGPHGREGYIHIDDHGNITVR